MTTYILHATLVHQALAKGAHGYATKCRVLIPAAAQFVKVETKQIDGVTGPVPTRGYLCGAGCFEKAIQR